MSCKIFTFPSFEKEAKRLNKRYKSFKFDLKPVGGIKKTPEN